MKTTRKILAALLAAALILALAACGSGNSSSGGTSAGSQTSSAGSASSGQAGSSSGSAGAASSGTASSGAASSGASSGTASSAGGKTVIPATIPNHSAPLAWQDENGALNGYEYEVLLAVNDLLEDYTLDISAVSDELQDVMAENGKSVVTAGGYYWNETRGASFLIPPTPTGCSAITIYVRSEDADRIQSLQDIADNGLSLVPSTPGGGIFNALTAWNEEHGNALGEIPTQEGNTAAEQVQALADGQYDALVIPNNLGVTDVIAATGLDVVATGEPVQVNGTYLLIQKGQEDLADQVEAALETLTENGTLSELAVKYYGTDTTENLSYVEPLEKNW